MIEVEVLFTRHFAIGSALGVLGVAALSGCGTYAGVGAITPTNGDRVEFGPSFGYRAYLGESSGVVLGGSATLGLPLNASRHPGRAFMEGRVGYGNLPLPTKEHVGFEAWLGPVVGWTHSSKNLAFAPGWTLGVGIPYRISPSKQPWELSDSTQPTKLTERALAFATLEPVLSFVQIFPVAGDRAGSPDNLFVGSLVLGWDSWLLVEP